MNKEDIKEEKPRKPSRKERREAEKKTMEKPEKQAKTRGDTRQHLIDATLAKIEADKNGMAGLSLREVTKGAGVSPTAFYRHFADLEELGLAVVEESGGMLRRLLRDVRKAENPTEMISKSVEIFVRYVMENRALWLMMSRERVGGSARIRAAIRNQITHYTTELASDLRLLNLLPQMTQSDLQRLSHMVIGLAVNSAVDILDLPADQPREVDEMVSYINRQLQILILGAINWKPRT